MLRSGAEHLERLKDGRAVYVGSERIDDVTAHPYFQNAARTVAAIYDLKRDPKWRDALSYEAEGERCSIYYLLPRTAGDLRRRMKGHKAIADLTYGLFGRSPDHVASFVAGMATNPSAFSAGGRAYEENIAAYYRHMRKNDIYASYAVVPPQAARNPEFYEKRNLPVPTLQVVREDDAGVVISGMKMLATAAAYADEIWIGNLIPLAPDQIKQAVTCAVPVNSPGLSLWSRQPFFARNEFDSPLAWRFDESDCMVIAENVRVPWERVFVMDDAVRAREIYIKTPGHAFGNHQSNVRFWSKLRLIVGLASRLAEANGADQIPAVRELLGRLAALEATLAGMIHGQIEAAESWPEGFMCFNRRMMYAALNWCTEMYSSLVDVLRDLSGGGVFQMPASGNVLADPDLKRLFEAYWQTPQGAALDRLKLFKLVWDLVGSEFAGRQLQYEKFYAGASFIVRNHNYREAPWDEFHAYADDLLKSYAAPEA
ncbi:MAG TPA: 4-hydroxyphenylacetate 3-hydroxylase N-terminal domain-containing protein [Stellaceae bacterium]|nr:4-hydroxyphenylacetate 3-hydroxylase N-terminal domain-containing protein [Stellaceae bacterium]